MIIHGGHLAGLILIVIVGLLVWAYQVGKRENK